MIKKQTNHLINEIDNSQNVNDKIIFSIDYSLSSRRWESGKIHFKWSARL